MTTTVREILQRRDAIRTELSGILDAHPDGALPDEVRARADALETSAGLLNNCPRCPDPGNDESSPDRGLDLGQCDPNLQRIGCGAWV
jgi:hypothetical protein